MTRNCVNKIPFLQVALVSLKNLFIFPAKNTTYNKLKKMISLTI
ncbi:hypothetical protein AAJ76_1900023973 [Vairimorpha ceranae]|uniref:Uncharacterized protein n=1 Tax=Vairimorpha ceranae TaxID=40302 RepID=A0A0F9WRG0_9MICR|nr:hypothetical protein AAJ76_1900023973 [Vairimorpha ceranae]KKO75498.1 hypothetical protein AAJ76_1900023973 [Vairimorpha ceranae]